MEFLNKITIENTNDNNTNNKDSLESLHKELIKLREERYKIDKKIDLVLHKINIAQNNKTL